MGAGDSPYREIDAEWRAHAESLFAQIRAQSFDGVGITRESFGSGESAAIELLAAFARSEGLEVACDRAANVVFSLPGSNGASALWCGSHLDSVPHGGNYDGLAGVVAGLLCLLRLKREVVTLRRPFKVIGMRGEESAWFGKAYVGSSALLGKLSPEDLDLKNRSGRTLGECMAAVGADIKAIRRQQPLIEREAFAGYIELHIEQGPIMVAREFPTAVVSGIRGNSRHLALRCLGEAGHSGAVPRWLRHDAVLAVADLLMRLDEHWRVLLERGLDVVMTAGVIGTNPAEHSVSRIPGEVTFSFEVRSQSKATLEAFYQLMRAECEAITRQRRVQFAFDRRIDSPPADLDPEWCRQLLEMSRRLGLPAEAIPSGAGHDAAVFSNAGIPSAMIFVRNEHGSHNPQEAMATDDFLSGVELLYRAALELR